MSKVVITEAKVTQDRSQETFAAIAGRCLNRDCAVSWVT